MMTKIGIRHEDKYQMEWRTPLTPDHIKALKDNHQLQFKLQVSSKRAFTDQEYKDAGAEVSFDLADCPIIMGVKEIPSSAFEKNKTYIFFSHVIKGQSYNMPMLRRMMQLGCNLIDYERIVDDQERRLIFFGRFAGLAGMINSLWSLGQRLKTMGIEPNPFAKIKQAYHYKSLDEARSEIAEAGKEIAAGGLPDSLLPVTIGLTGYGNVSGGAQEICDLLPVREITPDELLNLHKASDRPNNVVFKVVFKENHISKHRIDPGKFELQHYYEHPEEYINNLEAYIPHLTVLMNCMYWDLRYPRIFTKKFARKLMKNRSINPIVIGDVTCDPGGSIEFTHAGTSIDDPVFVYDPCTDQPTYGFSGKGILVMAVDILPSELPRDSSEAFGDALLNFIEPIAGADFSAEFQELVLPAPVKKALILHKGKLTPDYEYLNKFLNIKEITL